MGAQLTVQNTPNPNALKFVLNVPVKADGNYTYTSAGECGNNPLAKAIFNMNPSIREVYFFDNYITVTQDGSVDWNTIKEGIQTTILGNIEQHDPNFEIPAAQTQTPASSQGNPDLDRINAILDQTVRPALQMDGGDLQVIDYENKNLQISYQGACGSCPGARMGTLAAIQRILQDQFDPQITVSMAD